MRSRSIPARHVAESDRPEVDDAYTAPEPIPVALRDPGFRRLPELLELRNWVRETMCHLPGPTEADLLRRLEDAIVAERTEPLVAQRSFEPVTHCPHGHLGQHWIDQPVTQDGRPCIRRICRYASCAASWLEGR